MSSFIIRFLIIVTAMTRGQEKPRIGRDGRPLFNKPKLELCKTRKYHEKYGNHHYFLSWREPWTKFEDWDWFNARNYCRERCMDLISFEGPEEFLHFASILQSDNIRSIYTSGRKCNMLHKCEAPHLQPVNIHGWFWADTNKRIPPTNIYSRTTFWSRTGEKGSPQPDNFTGEKAGKLDNVKDDSGLTVDGLQEYYDEACLAVLNNRYNDGIQWHDVPCFFRSMIICEDSEMQMRRMRKEMGVDVRVPEES